MFAYCGNNPVVCIDNSGHSYERVIDFVSLLTPLVKDDLSNYDKYNTDEKKVLASNLFSSYRGRFVLRSATLTRSGSFGILVISQKAIDRKYPEDEVRHEYGHTVQLEQLGVIKYAACIGLPSLFEWGSDPVYYRRPWEITADIYGGVQSRSYPEYEAAGFTYLQNSKRMGALVWLTIE